MTANQRIVLNFVATYGRSLFSLVCGLFTGRWALMALGEVDFGLFGLVGGLVGFMTMLNNLMAAAVSRYYAYHVGRAIVASSPEEGLADCRRWFSSAVVLHTMGPLLFVAVGYPIGLWAVRSFLTIPADRIVACEQVWACVCVSCFVGMVNVPFSAMYAAKQYIAELTIYSFVQTTVNVCALYYMVSHPRDWLVVYAFVTALIFAIPQVVIGVRACCIFPECRFRLSMALDKSRIKELLSFAAYRFAGALTMMIQSQGVALLTNKLLGPARNAAMAIGTNLSSQTAQLSEALDTAIGPAITNACGAGDLERMKKLCHYVCKFSTLFMLVFALPLMLEVKEVMLLWLKTPPDYASSLCVFMLVRLVLEKMTCGHYMAIFAVGKIRGYQLSLVVGGILALPLTWVLMNCRLDLISVGIALVLEKTFAVGVRLYFGKTVAGLNGWEWFRRVFIPIAALSTVSLVFGSLSVLMMEASLLRIVVTTGLIDCALLSLAWFQLFDRDERVMLVDRFKPYFRRFLPR